MQARRNETGERRSNEQRSATTRAQIVSAARTLFVEKGYAGASTPDLVAAIGLTRGALYHHFSDKLGLFRAVIEAESAKVADAIRAAAPADSLTPLAALRAGTAAYLDAMDRPGRARLLLVEAPAALGRDAATAIDIAASRATLTEGLAALLPGTRSKAALADLLSASFDAAALAIAEGEPRAPYEDALNLLMSGLAALTSPS